VLEVLEGKEAGQAVKTLASSVAAQTGLMALTAFFKQVHSSLVHMCTATAYSGAGYYFYVVYHPDAD